MVNGTTTRAGAGDGAGAVDCGGGGRVVGGGGRSCAGHAASRSSGHAATHSGGGRGGMDRVSPDARAPSRAAPRSPENTARPQLRERYESGPLDSSVAREQWDAVDDAGRGD